jgi:hypothetical protein
MSSSYTAPVQIVLPVAVLQSLQEIADAELLTVPELIEISCITASGVLTAPLGNLGDGALVRGGRLTVLGADRVQAMWRSGATVTEIADHLEVKLVTARQELRGLGLLKDPLNVLSPKRERHSGRAALYAAVLQDFDSKTPVKVLAERYHLGLSTVYKLLQDNGRQLRRKAAEPPIGAVG